jgi:hypothetical protein
MMNSTARGHLKGQIRIKLKTNKGTHRSKQGNNNNNNNNNNRGAKADINAKS